jgi:hypothetical protein
MVDTAKNALGTQFCKKAFAKHVLEEFGSEVHNSQTEHTIRQSIEAYHQLFVDALQQQTKKMKGKPSKKPNETIKRTKRKLSKKTRKEAPKGMKRGRPR